MGRSRERQIQATEKRIVNRLPHYGRFDWARLGYFSLTTKETKFISKDDAITIGNETETPGYFFGQFMKGLWTAKQKVNQLDYLSYPYKAIPGKYPSCVYIDIRHAFKQIACAFGMEIWVREGDICGYGDTQPTASCFSDKICRGLLVTGTQKTGSFEEWKERDIRTVHFSNPNYAPHLQLCIWSTLHAIQAVLMPYTIYGHTDGFIVPTRHVQRVTRILDEYGFRYSVKGTGFCVVNGVGSYRVGDVETRLHLHPQGSRLYVREDNCKWWLRKFAEGIEYRNGINLSEYD